MPDAATIDTGMALASGAGAATSVLLNKSNDRWYRKLFDGLAGAIVGIWCGPAIADQAHLDDQHMRTAVAFLVGFLGWVLATMLADWAKGASVRDWLARFLPKPPS